MKTLAAVILTLAPVLTALGASEMPAFMRDLSPRGRHLVDRQVSVHKKALPDGRLRLSFEHSPLRSQDFSVDEARPLLTLHDRSPSWEKRLHEDYLAKYGPPAEHLPEALENSRQVMALRLSTRFMGTGFRDAAHELFNDPIFVSGVVLSTALYMAAWLAPEPFFSKAFASALTLILMTSFTVAEIRNVAVTVMRLYREADQARTMQELEKVAERFGKALGGTGLRLLVMVASYGLGKVLPGVPPGGLRGRRGAPAGAGALDDVVMTEVTSVQVVADGSVVVAATTLGNTAAAARAESICDDGSSKNGEWHHIATISNRKSSARGGPWTQRFETLFTQVGMSLKDSANLIHIQGHEGPHSEQYHREIFRRLRTVLIECTSPGECKQAFTNELKKIADDLCTPGTNLNKMLIKKASP